MNMISQFRFQPYGHAFGHRHNAAFPVFALADVNSFTHKVHIRNFHPSVDGSCLRKVTFCFSLRTNFQAQEQAQWPAQQL